MGDLFAAGDDGGIAGAHAVCCQGVETIVQHFECGGIETERAWIGDRFGGLGMNGIAGGDQCQRGQGSTKRHGTFPSGFVIDRGGG